MRVIACANSRGGCGKTSVSVNLAAALGERDYTVLVIDLDPSASATAWFGVQDEDNVFYEALTGNRSFQAQAVNTGVRGVDLVPASEYLAVAEKHLVGEVGSELILKRLISKLPDRWQFVLLDFPPHLGLLSINGLVAAGEVLVPALAHTMSLHGIPRILSTMETVQERLNPDLRLLGILAVRVDGRTRHSSDVLEALRKTYKKAVFKTQIRESVRVSESVLHCQPVTSYDPRGRAAEDFNQLAQEVVRRNPK